MSLVAFAHLLTLSILVGSNAWSTFIGGVIMFKNLPRHMFGNVQSKTFPWYFRILVVGNSILLYTLRELFVEHITPIANQEAILSFNYKNPFLLQIYLLIGSLFANIINMVLVGPWTTRVMFVVHKHEKDGKTPRDPELAKQKSLFSILHGVSSLLNLVSTPFLYPLFLSYRLRFCDFLAFEGSFM